MQATPPKTLNSSLLPRSRHRPSKSQTWFNRPPLLLCLPPLLSSSSLLQTLPTSGVTDEQVSSLESPRYSMEEWKWVILGQSAMRRSVELRRETNYTLLTQCLLSESKEAVDWWKKEMKYGSKSWGGVFSTLVYCSGSRAKRCFISQYSLCLCKLYTFSYSHLWIELKLKSKAAENRKNVTI